MANGLKTNQNQSISDDIKVQNATCCRCQREETPLVERSIKQGIRNTSSITHCTFIKIQCDRSDDNKTKIKIYTVRKEI